MSTIYKVGTWSLKIGRFGLYITHLGTIKRFIAVPKGIENDFDYDEFINSYINLVNFKAVNELNALIKKVKDNK